MSRENSGPLNDVAIRQLAGERGLVAPFSEGNLTPNGYDLTIASMLVNNTIQVASGQHFFFQPGDTVLVETNERLNMGPHIGFLRLRSTLARAGFFGSFGVIDAGFSGVLRTRLVFTGSSTAQRTPLVVGSSFAQIVFFRSEQPESSYGERSGTYQNLEVTLEQLERMCLDRLISEIRDTEEVPREQP